MNSFNENLECLKTVLKRKDLWQDLCDAYKEALCEIADRTRMDSWIASKLFLKYNYGIEVSPYNLIREHYLLMTSFMLLLMTSFMLLLM